MALQQESIQVIARNDLTTGVGTTVFTADSTGVKTFAPVRVMQDANVLHDKEIFNGALVATTVTGLVTLIREGRWQVDSFMVYFQTGSTSGTVTVTADSGTTAPGAGTAQLTGTVSLAAASQQLALNGTVIASPTVLNPGDRVSILIAGTMTSLANGLFTLSLKRIS